MRFSTLYRRTLTHYWPANLATVLAVAVAATVLTGALVIGDSMQAGLRSLAVSRLGQVEHALIATGLFTNKLPERIAEDTAFSRQFTAPTACIVTRGSIQTADAPHRVNQIEVIALEHGTSNALGASDVPADRAVVLSPALASRLNVRGGDEILLRLPTFASISPDTLLGRRDKAFTTLRLQVMSKWRAERSLQPPGKELLTAYVDLATLQRATHQPDRVNAMLVHATAQADVDPQKQIYQLQDLLHTHASLADYGLTFSGGSLKSEQLLLPPPVEEAARQAASELHVDPTGVLIHLANSISVKSGQTAIPYSVVGAVEHGPFAPSADDEIVLTDWAANDLHAKIGDLVQLDYYLPSDAGQASNSPAFDLETATASFKVGRIVPMAEASAARKWAPDYPGMTDAKRMSDWDPPFPIDLHRIRKQDETYWDRYGPMPKAFVSLTTGQRLWTKRTAQFGRLTSIETGTLTAERSNAFTRKLLSNIEPRQLGMQFRPIRAQALAAGGGSTDFAGLYLGFSFFLVIAAAMLIALLFQLNVEKRATHIGLLLATGFTPRTVTRMLLAEGLLLAAVGSVVGVCASVAYARVMFQQLSKWMPAAVSLPPLSVRLEPGTAAIGIIAGIAVSMIAIALAVRGLSRSSPRALLAGATPELRPAKRGGFATQRSYKWRTVGILLTAIALLLAGLGTASILPATAAFFGAGSASLLSGIAVAAHILSQTARGDRRHRQPWPGVVQLGLRNAARQSRRSLLVVSLVAFAAFVIVAVAANLLSVGEDAGNKYSGTGGFSLVAESTIPILQGLDGKADLARRSHSTATILPLRLRAGDDASCANMYQPRTPRIMAASEAFIDRGGFTFASSLAKTAEQKHNPWLLLNSPLPAGVVPAIGDEGTVTWLLHLGLGRDLTITDEHGEALRLRFVGLLSGSMLQSEVVIGEQAFRQHFPSIAGHNFFLIAVASQDAALVRQSLEKRFADYGLEVQPAVQRLAGYMAIENAYMRAFQSIGGLGLLLGTLGLAAVLTRNVLERRQELAVLLAVGYRRRCIGLMLLAETMCLLISGLIIGTAAAMIAAAPRLPTHAAVIPWTSLSALLAAVAVTGALAGTLALLFALRGSLVQALRND